jgi:hypothetical protein
MKQETFKTTNFNLAAYLFAKGLEYSGNEGENIRTFLFIDSPERGVFVNQYTTRRNCEVDFWELITAQKILKNEIHN